MSKLLTPDNFYEQWKEYRKTFYNPEKETIEYQNNVKVQKNLSQKDFSQLEDEIYEILNSLRSIFENYQNPISKMTNIRSCQNDEIILKIYLHIYNDEFRWDVNKKIPFIDRLDLYSKYLQSVIDRGNFVSVPGATDLLMNRNQISYDFYNPSCLSNPLFWDIFFINCLSKDDYMYRIEILTSGSESIKNYLKNHNFYKFVWKDQLFDNHIGCLILSIEEIRKTISDFFDQLEIIKKRIYKINYFTKVFNTGENKFYINCKCSSKSKKVKSNVFHDIRKANDLAEELDLYVYPCPFAKDFTGKKNYQYHLTSNYI